MHVTPGPTRAELRKRRLVALAFGAVWLVGLLVLLGPREHERDRSLLLFAHAVVPALLGAAALLAALSPGRLGLGPSARTTVALAIGAPIAFLCCAVWGPRADDPTALARGALFCGDIALAMGAVPLIALAWVERHTLRAAPPWRSLLLGVAAGLTAASTIGMHCPNTDGLHVALGHGWPIALLGWAGLRFLRKLGERAPVASGAG